MKITVTKQESVRSFVLAAHLPGLHPGDLVITVEASKLRIVGKQPDNPERLESLVDVPPGYEIAKAVATCINGELRIEIPRDEMVLRRN